MRDKLIHVAFMLLISTSIMSSQNEGLGWIIDVVDEITEETDLCERCEWVPPTISRVRLNTTEYIFLRYSCSIQDGYALMYDLSGNIISECTSQDGVSECAFGSNAFTIFTFADAIDPIWTCQTGYVCDFAMEYNIDNKVIINVDESACAQGIKTLSVPDDFVSYQWSGSIIDDVSSKIEVRTAGTFAIEVLDKEGCILKGEVTIEDIEELVVNIKAPKIICPLDEVQMTTSLYQSYQWSTGESDSTIFITDQGTYTLTVTNDQGCTGEASFSLDHYSTPDISITTEPNSVTEGNPALATAEYDETSHTLVAFDWSSDYFRVECDTCSETIFYPLIDRAINLDVTDSNGCITSTSLIMDVRSVPFEIYTPNVLRVQSTQNNDRFTIHGGSNVHMVESLKIYDRWGGIVYQNINFPPNDMAYGWDGYVNRALPNQEVFTFLTTVRFVNGELRQFVGDVLLLH